VNDSEFDLIHFGKIPVNKFIDKFTKISHVLKHKQLCLIVNRLKNPNEPELKDK
jgi:hypothetical protein